MCIFISGKNETDKLTQTPGIMVVVYLVQRLTEEPTQSNPLNKIGVFSTVDANMINCVGNISI